MPTPRPISDASVGETEAVLITCDHRPTAEEAQPSATTAVTSGSAMAGKDPNASRMMMAAAPSPMAMLLEGGRCVACSIALPPNSTWSPEVRAAAARSITRWMSFLLS